ncbi:MAG: protein kinase [Myxococcales bacterium]|nr:protein kinase [Myxococcales bacterium]
MTRCARCQRRLPPSGECPDHGKPTAVADVTEYQEPPRVLAPPGWTLGPQLASGGSALVYQVTRGTAPPAVMKFGRWREMEIRARFSLEADVLRAVGAPATPAYIEHGLVADWPYLIMEHVPGETLASWMSRIGERGGLGEIVAILTRIAGALHALHAAGYVHRDLKPENIMIGGKGIRLLDFGLVKSRRAGAPSLTQVGGVVGTPHYLAPEQIRMGSAIDHRADLYSLGVIAFEMLAGRPPFIGERRAIEYHHLVCKPPSVCETRAIPQPLDEIVTACLAKQPEGRPQTADELRGLLSDALSSLGTLRGVVAVPEKKQESKPLGTTGPVALAWIERGDPVSVTRAVTEVHGIVVRQRGDGILVAFSSQHHDAPLSVALGVCRSIIGERRRVALHLTTALVRRSAQGKPTVYGPDIEQPERWIPAVPFTGIVLSAAAAETLPGGATPASDVPGFFRESQRDRTDATDAKVDPPLIGRENLVRSLTQAADEASSMLIGVSGLAGAGKTRVLRAVAERLQAAGREVIRVSGRRRFPGDRADDERLAAALGGGHDVVEALGNAAARNAILAIDDLQWFSPSVRQLLIDAPVPLVRIIASPEPAFEVMDFAQGRISVELPPLSYADADALLREMLRPARLIPDALVERLVIRGTGNPRLLIGLARDIKSRGAIRRQLGGSDWYVAVDELDTLLAPPGPSWFASRLLEDLPLELSPIVRLCAGLGPKFCVDEVAHVTEAREVDVRLGLLVREGVFVERNAWYEFEDAGIQEAIYDHILDERLLVHQRALRYWLASPDRNTIGRLSRIAFHAEGAAERSTAAACWIALARQAVYAGDAARADELLGRTLACLEATVPAAVVQALASLV